MPGHPPSEPQPLSLLLLRISEELHALQAEGRTIEDAIGHAILGGAPSTRETLANLQSIDLIVQSLGELGTYVSALQHLLKDGEMQPIGVEEGTIYVEEHRTQASWATRCGWRH